MQFGSCMILQGRWGRNHATLDLVTPRTYRRDSDGWLVKERADGRLTRLIEGEEPDVDEPGEYGLLMFPGGVDGLRVFVPGLPFNDSTAPGSDRP